MPDKKKIAIIGTVGLPAKYGGFETLTSHLVENLGDRYQMTVYCTAKKYPKEKRTSTCGGARLVYLPFDANGVQSIPYDTLSILHALFYADVLLILGVAGAWILPFVRLFTHKKIIISIDGIEWKRDKWSRFAKWYLWWAEKIAVRYSHADISDNESIQDYTAIRYKQLSHIIEYGADHTLAVKPSAKDREKYPFLQKPYAFKVCRIEPENNVHLVLEAFSKMPLHTIVMIGNWKNSRYGVSLYERYRNQHNIILLDPIYDQYTLDLIRGNALIYLHGHSAGGTNPSLVEAMYLGLPIVTWDVSYNRTTTEGKAFYFRSAEDIIDIVHQTKLSAFRANGLMMKEVANRRYTWKVISEKYGHLIEAVSSNRKKLPVVPMISDTPAEELLNYELGHLQVPALFYEKR